MVLILIFVNKHFKVLHSLQTLVLQLVLVHTLVVVEQEQLIYACTDALCGVLFIARAGRYQFTLLAGEHRLAAYLINPILVA